MDEKTRKYLEQHDIWWIMKKESEKTKWEVTWGENVSCPMRICAFWVAHILFSLKTTVAAIRTIQWGKRQWRPWRHGLTSMSNIWSYIIKNAFRHRNLLKRKSSVSGSWVPLGPGSLLREAPTTLDQPLHCRWRNYPKVWQGMVETTFFKDSAPTFDPLLGFPNGRVARVLNATQVRDKQVSSTRENIQPAT